MYDRQSSIEAGGISQTGVHREAPHGSSPSFIRGCNHRVFYAATRRRAAPTHPIVLRIDGVGSGALLIFQRFATELCTSMRHLWGSGVRAAPELRPSARQIPTSPDTSLLRT